MFEKKYIIIIAIVVCLFILYYFYDELSSIKKMYIPTYQKTMALEARLDKLDKLDKLEKKPYNKKDTSKDVDSTALTITYQSDMVKNGNLSAKYVEISESESKELLKNIEQSKMKQNVTNRNRIPAGDISDPKPVKVLAQPKSDIMDFENSEINIPVAGLLKKNSGIIKSDSQTAEYQQIYESLKTTVLSNDEHDDFNDKDMRDFTESIQYADIPSENTVSDIPAKTSKTSKNSKPKRGKKSVAKQTK